MTHQSLTKKSQAGFTLVELAIVMIIIGLLIGGVLKGQELIGNAQIAATASQVKAYDTATTTFNDIYDGLPGDLDSATVRVPNCGACADGNGDGFVTDGNAPGAASGGERDAYWNHLHFADLIGGVEPAAGAQPQFPEGKIAGEFTVGYFGGGALGNNASAFAGHYVTLSADGTAAAADNTLSASEAARLDRKLDDGIADSGSVFTESASCDDGAGVYQEADQAVNCDMHFRIQ